MVGTKRSADDSGPTTRSAKAPKTDKTSAPKGKKGANKKSTPKAALPASQFKAKALPLHVNVTHTPPSAAEDDVPVTSADPGQLGSVTLVPSSFNTGSYGWKGNKRLTVELENDTGTKEKVQVMLTINATVLHSKNAPTEEEANGEDAKAEEDTKAEDAQEDKDGE